MGTISGVIYDDTGNPASRIVRAYRRDTGALLGEASSAAADAVDGDDNFADVSLLLHFDGTNGSTSLVDSSTSAHTVSVFGNAQISTAQSKFGGASLLLDGLGDYITLPAVSVFNFGSGDFTVEAWIRRSSIPTWAYFLSLGSFLVAFNGGSNLYISNFGGGNTVIGFGTTTDTWFHLAVVRHSGTFYAYKDGVLQGSGADRTTPADQSLRFGLSPASGEFFHGHIDDIRVTKGLARYTSGFSPPAVAFPNGGDIAANTLGDYLIDCGAYAGEVQRIVLDDDGGTLYNDKIDRVLSG